MTPKRMMATLVISVILGEMARAQVSFNRDIRPIMSDTCFRCHGPDKNARFAGLRLDIREEALRPPRPARHLAAPSGIDHLRLTVKFQGLDARLTGVSGAVVKEILA